MAVLDGKLAFQAVSALSFWTIQPASGEQWSVRWFATEAFIGGGAGQDDGYWAALQCYMYHGSDYAAVYVGARVLVGIAGGGLTEGFLVDNTYYFRLYNGNGSTAYSFAYAAIQTG